MHILAFSNSVTEVSRLDTETCVSALVSTVVLTRCDRRREADENQQTFTSRAGW